MHFDYSGRLSTLFLASLAAAFAQPSVPTLSQPIPAQRIGAVPVPIDLRNFIGLPGVTGQVVQFTTTSGRFNVDLLVNEAPRHAANFLAYTSSRAYDNTVFHNVVRTGPVASAIQGGAFTAVVPPTLVPQGPQVAQEYGIPNTRGTLAAARGPAVNSATSEWFFNLQDNSSALGPTSPNGGYSVFGRVLGSGMNVVDALAAFATYGFAGTPFTAIPLRNFGANQVQLQASNYIVVNSVRQIPVYPSTIGEPAVLNFTASRSSTTVLNVAVSGSTLTIFPLAIGTANVTVRATDSNSNFVDTTFSVTVTTQPLLNPLFTSQPTSHTVGVGSTVALVASASGSPNYQWLRNGVIVPGATSSRLILSPVTIANAGTYTCVATNAVGSTTSAPATLEVATIQPIAATRLGNLSILTNTGSGGQTLTVGAVVGPAELIATLPLVVRAVGPTLGNAPFNVPGVLADPQLVANRGGVNVSVATNDNWGGTPALTTAFANVGAFALPPNSLDSAALLTTTSGSYTVQVSGKNDASGLVIAELYDAAGANRDALTPRLINVSTLTQIENASSLTVGFVLTGQGSRTVLIRGVGPSLDVFGVPETMVDPRLELFDNTTGQKIGENDDWSGDPQLAAMSASVGAFQLANAQSKDAAMLVTLRPGPYSARIIGANNLGGNAIVEVYEIP